MKTQRFPLVASVVALLLILLLIPTTAFASSLRQDAPPTQGRLRAAANLRAAPGTASAILGSAKAGTVVSISGCNAACDWYHLDSGEWVAAILVEPVAGSTGRASPGAAAQPKSVAPPTPTPRLGATVVVTGTVASAAGNLRAGPGTTYAVVGGVQAGEKLTVTGQTAAGDWLQLEDGNWIAAFLVSNVPVSLAVAAAPPAPAVPASSAPAASANTTGDNLQVLLDAWGTFNDLNVPHACGHFEYKVTDVRRIKSLWWGRSEYIAQGEWLLVFVEVKNISPGTSYFGKGSPRLSVITADGRIASGTGDSKASAFAGWMYQHGRFYEDINPGVVLGLVEAYDLPLEPDMLVAFNMLECGDDILGLGLWSQVPPPDSK